MPVLLGEGNFDGHATGFAFSPAQHFLWPDVQKPDCLVAEPSLLAIDLNARIAETNNQPEPSQDQPVTAHSVMSNKHHSRPNLSKSSAGSGQSGHGALSSTTADTTILEDAGYGMDEYDSEADDDDGIEVRDSRILVKGRAGHLNDETDNSGSPVHIAMIADNITDINCEPKNQLKFAVRVDYPCKIMRAKRCVPPGGEEELLVADS
ncbi:hypothetical protein ACHAPT_012260 [Fusarium lateritium]